MKTEIIESRYGLDIILTPESVEDVAKLLRFSKNAKKEPPSVYTSFGDANIVCNIYMAKVNETVQKNSISNK